MSNSSRAKHSLDHRRRMGGSDPRGDNPVHVMGVTVAGARPEASRLIIMMTLPFTVGMSAVAIGAAMAIGRWGSRRRAASGND